MMSASEYRRLAAECLANLGSVRQGDILELRPYPLGDCRRLKAVPKLQLLRKPSTFQLA